jgi:hypothetical protein
VGIGFRSLLKSCDERSASPSHAHSLLKLLSMIPYLLFSLSDLPICIHNHVHLCSTPGTFRLRTPRMQTGVAPPESYRPSGQERTTQRISDCSSANLITHIDRIAAPIENCCKRSQAWNGRIAASDLVPGCR